MPKQKKTPKREKDKSKQETRDAHAIWKGYITFGLVNIPIVLISAEKQQEEVHFKLLDKHKLSPIKYVRVNAQNGKEVAWEDIVKGFEYEPGTFVILEEADFQEIASENLKLIEIEDFVDKEEVASVYFEKPYYLLPDKRGEKGYILLRETLKNTNKIGIARVMIRSHQYLASIIPYGEAIMINTLRYPAELKDPTEVKIPQETISHYKISKKEFDIAAQLVETMSVKWDPKRYKNEYRVALLNLIKEKIASKGKRVTKHIEEPKISQPNIIDFMDLLKQSVQQKRETHRSARSVTKKGAHPRKHSK
ncbi:MAG: Ku protein [Proteobacteria bacterium]|nr:Ku protein [Pseudomonadota bacterium]